MKTRLFGKYWKYFALAVILSLNLGVKFTPQGISMDVKQVYAQEGGWDSGANWLSDFEETHPEGGDYMVDSEGNIVRIVFPEVVITATPPTPLFEYVFFGPDSDWELSDLWKVETDGSGWNWYDYIMGDWINYQPQQPEQLPPPTYIPLYVKTVSDLEGKKYLKGANGPDQFDCSGAVCWGLRKINPSFGDYTAHQLFNLFTKPTTSAEAGILVFYDYTSDGRIEHVTTLTGDGNMIHPSSGSGEILKVPDTYLDSYTSSHGGTKYYREIDWSAVNN